MNAHHAGRARRGLRTRGTGARAGRHRDRVEPERETALGRPRPGTAAVGAAPGDGAGRRLRRRQRDRRRPRGLPADVPVGSPFDSKEAAAATAAYRVLLNLCPAQKPSLDAQYATSLGRDRRRLREDARHRGRGGGGGGDDRGTDGRRPLRCLPLPGRNRGPGLWRPVLPAFVNDPFAWLKDVRPFLIKNATQFRSDGPLALTSKQYARDFDRGEEVRLGDEHGPELRPDAARPATGRRTRRRRGAASSARSRRSSGCR